MLPLTARGVRAPLEGEQKVGGQFSAKSFSLMKPRLLTVFLIPFPPICPSFKCFTRLEIAFAELSGKPACSLRSEILGQLVQKQSDLFLFFPLSLLLILPED